MGVNTGWCAGQLRLELMARNRSYALAHLHVESYGTPPVIVYEPAEGRHGNFYLPAYEAITARADWMRRFDKVHTQGKRSLPKPSYDLARKWRELDSSMSSDALLMNVFCTPGVAEIGALRDALGVEGEAEPVFGWKARVPLANGRFDRTEVDMRFGSLLVEAKLTESDFQTREASIVEAYRDFDSVFDPELLPQVELVSARRRDAVEFPESYSQEFESVIDTTLPMAELREIQEVSASNLAAEAYNAGRASVQGYLGYQLIRNVLAAYATNSSFCVIHDERRPDLREAWFDVMGAVRSAEMRTRLKVVTWQELAAYLPEELQEFLDLKYGIVKPGRVASAGGDLREME
jgi:hypothetical protein